MSGACHYRPAEISAGWYRSLDEQLTANTGGGNCKISMFMPNHAEKPRPHTTHIGSRIEGRNRLSRYFPARGGEMAMSSFLHILFASLLVQWLRPKTCRLDTGGKQPGCIE
jgi:hypothetical protein